MSGRRRTHDLLHDSPMLNQLSHWCAVGSRSNIYVQSNKRRIVGSIMKKSQYFISAAGKGSIKYLQKTNKGQEVLRGEFLSLKAIFQRSNNSVSVWCLFSRLSFNGFVRRIEVIDYIVCSNCSTRTRWNICKILKIALTGDSVG